MRSLLTALCFALSLLIVAVTLPRPSFAQARDTWVQIEALPNLTRAQDRAAAWSTLFPDVSGFQLSSGWYALAIGPYERIEASQRLNALKQQGTIPDDSYIAEQSRFGAQFWPGIGAAPDAATGLGEEIAVTPLPQTEATGEAEDLAAQTRAAEDAVRAANSAASAQPEAPARVLPQETLAEARMAEAAQSREDRQEIQTALKHEGFYNSGIDGAFGPGTRTAISAWQVANGFEASGVLFAHQQAQLVQGYRGMLASLGLQEVRDNTAGIAVQMPTALVQKGEYQPPFAHYDSKDGSGVQVLLLSQTGDAGALGGLYDILQTVELVPPSGPREQRDRGFTIEGRDAQIVTHVEARLTPQGLIKGFMLVWPLNDEARRKLVLTAMQDSFTPLGDSVLSQGADTALQEVNLVAGLQPRRPDLSRTGVFVDAKGHVLTSADAVGSCGRVTIERDTSARVLALDPVLGLALLAPEVQLAPLGVAQFAPSEPKLGSEIAVSGYAYEGKLGAAVITYGRLADLRGLDGSGDVYRLDVTVTEGEAGAPVLDGAGAVSGLLLSHKAGTIGGQGARQVLPDSVVFAAAGQKLTAWLSENGIAPQMASSGSDIAPAALAELARDMTVSVACWK